MKRSRTTVPWAVAALVLLGFAGPAQADSGSGRNRAEVVEVQDRCDPATFNAAIGPGTCVGDGDTTFDEFLDEFQADGAVGHWRFHPDELEVVRGQSVRADNVGGEFHTFTPVNRFGPGCVELLNQPGDVVPELCNDPALFFPGTGVLPGESRSVSGLARGAHRFQCLIHPWMQTVVRVR